MIDIISLKEFSKLMMTVVQNKYKIGTYWVGDVNYEFKNMKFDVVLGNPPYQQANSQKKLWYNFFIKSLTQLVEKDGFIVFLTPSSFLLRDGVSMDKLRNLLLQTNVRYLNFDATKSFKVGENIVGSIIENRKSNILTEVVYNGVSTAQNLNTNIFPTLDETHRLIKLIFEKVKPNLENRIKLREDINNSQHRMVESGELSETQDGVYKYPVIYTPNTIHYAKELFGDQDALRLMVTIAGTYYSEKNPDKNIFISRAHSGQGMCHILINSEVEGLNIKSFLTSNLFRFIIHQEKTSGYNTGFGKLSMLDCSKFWNDQEIYKYFNLTQEEIDLIESTIK